MTLLIAVLLAVAAVGTTTTVYAQTVAAPRAQVVDAQNVVVGEVVAAQPLTVLIRVDRLTFAVYIENKYTLAAGFSALFTTADCTGPMYMTERPGLLEDVAVIDGFRVYIADVSVPRETVTPVAAYFAGRCNQITGDPTLLRPTKLLIDLTDRWALPFRVR
jgi:hypothetical protein